MVHASSTVKKTPMINEVTISNFKGIKNCEIKNISKVNLFIGKNDCGKSSIVEAICSTCKEFLGANLPFSIRRRSTRDSISGRELWYGYYTDSSIEISMKFDNSVTIGTKIDLAGDHINATLKATKPEDPKSPWSNEGSIYFIGLSVSLNRGRREPPFPDIKDIMQYLDDAILLDSSIITDLPKMEGDYLSKTKLLGEDMDVAKRHADIYGKQAGWEFIPHPDFPRQSRVALPEYRRRVFLDDFGDGPRYGLAIISAAKTIHDTALLIEEIESHQHPGSLRKLIKHLIEISKDNNLQLFITTHSFDTFRFLYYYYTDPEERKKEFRCFHVVRDATGKVDVKPEENIGTIRKDIFEIEYSS